MRRYEFSVNGTTFFSKHQEVDAAVLLRTAWAGKAIGKDPDSTGYVLRVRNSNVKFVSGQLVNLAEYRIFRAGPERGAPFS